MKKFEGILITTDLDGTLLRNDTSISRENLDAIEYFKESASEEKKTEFTDTDELPEKEKRFAETFMALSPSNQHTLLVIAEALLRDQAKRLDPEE